MHHDTVQVIAGQRTVDAIRTAETARIRREFARTPARWHFPRVNWHFPAHARVAGA